MNLLPFVASGIGLGAVYALSSVGLVILYRASGTLNFAFGAFGGISAFLAWQLTQDGVPTGGRLDRRHRRVDRHRLCLWPFFRAALGAS